MPLLKQYAACFSKQGQNKNKMKNLITLAKKLFKPLAVVKYLCFPFLMAQSQGTVDFKTVTGGEIVTAQVEVENTIWMATNNGIYQVNKTNGKTTHLTTQNSVLPSNHITGICTTPNGNVYAATDNGIFRFDGSAFLVISTENAKLPTNKFTAIASDERGRLFVGTSGQGLVMLEGYRCKVFNSNNSAFTSNTINHVYCNDNGLIIAEQANGNIMVIGLNNMAQINQPQIDLDAVAKRN
jgi:ligand-binding sensor domain-containing protein